MKADAIRKAYKPGMTAAQMQSNPSYASIDQTKAWQNKKNPTTTGFQIS